jgi:hypothetical protein
MPTTLIIMHISRNVGEDYYVVPDTVSSSSYNVWKHVHTRPSNIGDYLGRSETEDGG